MCVLTGGAGHNCTHERSDGNNPISMRSWAGEVQSFTCPLPCGELRSRFVGLGDKKQQTEGGTIYWSNDNVRISKRVNQAAQLLLLCNGNAGIQFARTARITAIRPPTALCATATLVSTGSLSSPRGSAIASRIWAFERIAPPTKATSPFSTRRRRGRQKLRQLQRSGGFCILNATPHLGSRITLVGD